MKKIRIIPLLLALSLLVSCSGVKSATPPTSGGVEISLSDSGITVDGTPISENALSAVYASNDIVYYESGTDFTYGEGTASDMHDKSEASAHTVINITKPGTYSLSGSLSKGQIAIDLGPDADDNPKNVVNLILNGVDISCSVAPAIIFYDAFECGDDDEDEASENVDTKNAGANIIIADGTVNNINGSYVARIYESIELDSSRTKVEDYDTLHKYDAAINSEVSMNIYGGNLGDGILNVNAENEGISTNLHLTVYGGNIKIISGNDGINTNEDNVSVMRIKGGNVNVTVNGATGEGDGIDSNGWLIIEDGTVRAFACSDSMDTGLDADRGVYIRGGDVIHTGNMFDRFESVQNSALFQFGEKQKGSVTAYSIKNANGEEIFSVSPKNDFSQLVVSSPRLSEGEYSILCEGEKLLVFEGEANGNHMPQRGEASGFGERKRPDSDGNTPPPDFRKDREFPRREGDKEPPSFDGQMPEALRSHVNVAIDESKFSDIFTIKKGLNVYIVK